MSFYNKSNFLEHSISMRRGCQGGTSLPSLAEAADSRRGPPSFLLLLHAGVTQWPAKHWRGTALPEPTQISSKSQPLLWDPLLAANPLRVLLLGRSSPVPLASHKCPVLIAHVLGGSPSPPAPFPLYCSLASPCIPFDFQPHTHLCFLEDRDWHRGKN